MQIIYANFKLLITLFEGTLRLKSKHFENLVATEQIDQNKFKVSHSNVGVRFTGLI